MLFKKEKVNMENVSEVKCPFCEEFFGISDILFKHIKLHYTPTGTIFQCYYKECFQKFNLKWNYKRHVLNHVKKNKSKVDNVSNPCEHNLCDQSAQENIVNTSETPGMGEFFCGSVILGDWEHIYKTNLDNIHRSINTFLIQLHSISNLTRSNITSIQKLMEELVLEPLLKVIEDSTNVVGEKQNKLSELSTDVRAIFKDIKSEHKFSKNAKNMGLISEPDFFTIANDPKSKAMVMPIDFQLKNFFEKDDCLRDILNYIEIIERTPHVNNFIQCDLWKQKKSLYPNNTLIPYFMYLDDFGINNALGSKSSKNSVCNFYYSFPCLPKKSSKFNEIFLLSSVLSADIKKHGDKCYISLVEKIKSLELDGIDIDTRDGTKRVHFILGLVLGDNLGLNVTLGFTKSFSGNNYCRFCLMKKLDAQCTFKEIPDIMRNRRNYALAFDNNELPESGITSSCALNDIPSFHVTENFAIDVMHDIYEGVAHLILCHSLHYFIKIMQYISIGNINSIIKSFSYFKNDKGTEKAQITLKEIENGKLKLSARQMMSFCYYFPLMFGEHIPQNDVVYNYVLTFLRLIDEILCFKVDDNLIAKIKNDIEVINKDYVTLFKSKLTPKFHMLTHYPTIIQKSGPLRNLWNFKYEGKHREFKVYSHVITSRRHIPKSFAFKHQMKFANFLLSKGLEDDNILKKETFEKNREYEIIKLLKNTDFSMFAEGEIWGYKYDSKSFVATLKNGFHVLSVVCIVQTHNLDLYLYCQKLEAEYDSHFGAFQFRKCTNIFELLHIEDVVGPPVQQIKTPTGKIFIKPKEFYHILL